MTSFLEFFLCLGSTETDMVKTGCSNRKINLLHVTEGPFIIMHEKFAVDVPHLLMFLYFLTYVKISK